MLLLAAVALILFFPVASLKGVAEQRLSERFGRPVTIDSIDRENRATLSPVIRVRGVRVPQADWAGSGDLVRVSELRIRVRVISLLLGRFSPQVIAARGVWLDLVRDRNRRTNWSKPDARKDASGGDAPRLDALGIADATIRYRDAVQNRSATLRVHVDPARGLIAHGSGLVDGAAVTIIVRGGVVRDSGSWPFAVALEGGRLSLRAQGRMRAPLDTDHMGLTVETRADDLKRLDRVIEAGLFGTQPIALTASVRHDDRRWTIRDLRGTIGRSDLSGRVTVDKVGGRTRLDGEVHSGRFDFDDLSTNAGIARGRALEARIGPRVVPNTRVNLSNLDSTDGRITVRIDRIISRDGPVPVQSISGTLLLDRQRLIADPIRMTFAGGRASGRVTINQRGGASLPLVTVALDLSAGRLGALTGGSEVEARFDGRVRLRGRGDTVRDAIGRSDGTIGLVARDGALPARLAAMLGFDAGRALTAADDTRARLRCAVLRIPVTGGRGRFAPLIVDTSVSQTRGQGGITFPAEVISGTLTGAPKRAALLRLPGSVTIGGSLSAPRATVPDEVKSVGNVLKGIGRAITGRQGPTASDADCASLSRQAIGR